MMKTTATMAVGSLTDAGQKAKKVWHGKNTQESRPAAKSASGQEICLQPPPLNLTLRSPDWRYGESRTGERFAHQSSHILRSCDQAADGSQGAFYYYDGKRGVWSRDNISRATAIYKAMVEDMRREAGKLKGEEWLEAKAFIASVDSVARMRSTFTFAKASPGFSVGLGDFDINFDLLNLANGTFEFKAGLFRKHRSEDLLTQKCNVDFDPAAHCPLFEKTLFEILHPDDGKTDAGKTLEMIDYIQRFLGYCLDTSVDEHALLALCGNGGNGKGVLMDILRDLLGTYSVTVPFKILQTHDDATSGQATPELASLKGTRLCVAEEAAEDRKLDTGTLKWITGGGKINARYLRGQPFEFSPTHKIILAFNERPAISDDGDGTWRRLRLVPFPNKFEAGRRDNRLGEKLRAEKAGILNWMLQGHDMWRKRSLSQGEPEMIVVATKAYREDEDAIGQFISEKCEVLEGAETMLSVLFKKYECWAGSTRFKFSSKGLAKKLEVKGFKKTRNKQGVKFYGISIQPD